MAPQPILKLALIQTKLHWENPSANRAHFDQLLESQRPQMLEADLILLPEMFSTGFSMQPSALAEKPKGPSFLWMQEKAQAYNSAIAGSLMIEEGGKYYNRLFFVYPDGHSLTYNKRHLFTLAGEEKVYTAGQQKVILEYKGWRINPQICYDLRFPVWCRNDNDFDLQFFVANWPERRAEAWSTLLKARAIENQAYVVGVNRIGDDGNGVYHSGHSAAHDALGEKISQTEAHQESVELVELHHGDLQKIRTKLSFLKDRDQFDLKF